MEQDRLTTKVTRPVATSPALSTSDRVSPIPWKPVLRVPNRLVVPNVSVVLPFFRQLFSSQVPCCWAAGRAAQSPSRRARAPRAACTVRPGLSRVIYASTINQVDRRNSYGIVHRLTRAPRRGGGFTSTGRRSRGAARRRTRSTCGRSPWWRR